MLLVLDWLARFLASLIPGLAIAAFVAGLVGIILEVRDKRKRDLEWVTYRAKLVAEEFDYSCIAGEQTTDEGETAQ